MKKILIIEDDQLVANIYRNKFAAENYKVEVALDGESGFENLNSFHPDVIILDLMLPKMSGLDLLTKIRAQDKWKQLPVIVFSNTFLSNMVQQAWAAGATKCLSKASCTPRQVIEVVRSLLPQSADSASDEDEGIGSGKPHSRHAKTAPLSDSDAALQAELRKVFLADLSPTIAACRANLQAIVKNAEETDRAKNLDQLYRRIHTLTGNAAIAGEPDIAQLADALEALLRELCEKPKTINASILRTLAMTLDFASVLFERASQPQSQAASPAPKFNILVVDDEAISRRAVTYALEKAKLTCTAVENPEAALKLLAENGYDLVFLDVDMPGMNGFELCTKLRTFARNKTTPVVFVTSLTDFESRANSTMSGGNDLIAKPFLFMELAVKALIYVLRGKIARASA
ncbi:MAG TPA: response regulator [Verrucomicrobiae bacterium]|jgi:DNA-binding response OmpR family regulator|nr:response regulator [Verrucomicrobiae bacterium]